MLKLTKKADYGLIALRHLAAARGNPNSGTHDSRTHNASASGHSSHTHSASASAKDIADTYRIPLPLLSKILQNLARAGLLVSEQGTHGGYRLARDPEEITALEVIRTIDGPIILTHCFTEHAECDQSDLCPVREPLRKVHEGIVRLLSSISISDMTKDDMRIPSIQPLSNIQNAGRSSGQATRTQS